MNKIWIIVKKNTKEIIRSKSIIIGIGLAAFLILMTISVFRISINFILKAGLSVTAIDSYLQPFLGSCLYAMSLTIMIYSGIYINSFTLTIEKTKHSVESLLCTSITLKQFWIGETLAMFVPSLILGLLSTFGALCALNGFVVIPVVKHWIIPDVTLIMGIVLIIPVVFFLMCCIFTLLQLILTNIRWINGAFSVVAGASFIILTNLTFTTSSWSVFIVSFGIAVVLAIVVLFLLKHLSKKGVILSSIA